jgi:hypothetical protein
MHGPSFRHVFPPSAEYSSSGSPNQLIGRTSCRTRKRWDVAGGRARRVSISERSRTGALPILRSWSGMQELNLLFEEWNPQRSPDLSRRFRSLAIRPSPGEACPRCVGLRGEDAACPAGQRDRFAGGLPLYGAIHRWRRRVCGVAAASSDATRSLFRAKSPAAPTRIELRFSFQCLLTQCIYWTSGAIWTCGKRHPVSNINIVQLFLSSTVTMKPLTRNPVSIRNAECIAPTEGSRRWKNTHPHIHFTTVSHSKGFDWSPGI